MLVKLNYDQNQNLPQVNPKLTAMGIHEQITIYMATGAGSRQRPGHLHTGAGCAPGPPVKVLVGTDGTEVIAPGQSAGNTAAGTFHLARCTVAH